MATGKTYKQCGCRDESGRRLGQKCSKLRRTGGAWSAIHGTWHYQLELPLNLDGKRRSPLRRGGFDSQGTAQQEMDHARKLLALADPDDIHTLNQITEAILTSLKETHQLPDADGLRRQVRSGRDLTRRLTVGDWLDEWLTSRIGLRKNTYRSYQSHIRLYYLPHIGRIRLDRLQVSDVASVFDAIDELNDTIEQARRTGDTATRALVKGRRPVGAASKQRIRATLRAALNAAIKQRLIDINVAALVELPSGKRPKALIWTPERVRAWRADYVQRFATEHQRPYGKRPLDVYISTPRPSAVMVWTPEQTGAFLSAARTHDLYALYHLIALRGLRRGEACGLRWSDVDLKAGIVTVRWQITQLGWATDQGQPKSEAGERHVALDSETIKVLRAHRKEQRRKRLALGGDWVENDFVFTQGNGATLHPAHVTDQFERLAHQADLPPVRLHDLRHGAATLILAAGHDLKVVQETLGLSSITIAADTYTSVLPDLARQAAEDAAALIPLRR
ncbi:tyrosine-type recombinase/integrase [Microtetraspora malaysiensis]|uniref:tyrosine-type recombinase/integrase n=1 Tax=Microtetraspora malaysiensis TaxID=161358 RepID=UPI00083521B7|nr:tyrosine-type recombinase/integrase [Microtetraspora malaysiensis]